MSSHFTHLHLHTEYSLLDGAIRLPDLISFAKKQEWKAVGISDHGNIFGAVKFFQLAKKNGIRPILGTEMYLAPDVAIKNAQEKYYHLIIIVQNKEGYQNLCRLMAFAYQEGYYFKPRVDYKTLERYSRGLIISTACVGGHIPTLLRNNELKLAHEYVDWGLTHFGKDRFFFELAPALFDLQTETNTLLLQYAKEWGVRAIATCDSHYLLEEDREAHEVLLSVQTKDLLSNPDRFSFGECRVFVRTTEQMLSYFQEQQELIWNTGEIADSCEFAFEFDKLFFPQCPVPKEHTQESFFRALCREGLDEIRAKRLPADASIDVYEQRLVFEMEMIIKMGFVGYFLVVSDFIRWAKSQGISVGPGRGSGAGSLVAWALKITNIDPLAYNLLFERFLNPERISMPDFDIDFCIERREEVINYVKDKYGHDNVCQIITFGTMMAKGVIKDVARALGLPFQEANAITELIPDQLKITLQESIDQEPQLQELIANNPLIKKIFAISLKLEGLTRHASKHAAGIVISPEPLNQSLPLYIPPKTNDLVAQYAMTELEAIGFLKMDFLGLKNLTVIDRTVQAVKKNHGISIDLDQLELTDRETFELLSRGQTNAVFQFESEGIKEVLRKLQPDKFEDLIAVNALYRPGPLGAGMVDDYIERRHGRQPVVYMFPELEPILQETYGVIVYQEQVMKIASAIAGYSLGASDILRRAMGKKKADVMAEQRELFVQGAIKNNFDGKKSGELFDLMAYFAGYGFNKSHSAAYALIAYHTAYLKAHYPREFMAASVTFETSNPDQLTKYLQEIKDLGIKTISPSINQSDIEFTAQKDAILFGLEGIKNVGLAALQTILESRKEKEFTDLLDFCKRVDLRTVNKRVIESLIFAGAFDELPGNRAQKYNELEKILDLAHAAQEAKKTGQLSLFSYQAPAQTGSTPLISSLESGYVFKPLTEWSSKEKLEKEKEVAGFYLSSHPLQSYPATRWLSLQTFAQCLQSIEKVTSLKEPSVLVYGLLQNHKVIVTKKGDRMAFANYEDFSCSAEIIIFPSVYKQAEQYLGLYNVFLIRGFVDITSPNRCKIKAQTLMPLDLLWSDETTIGNLSVIIPPTWTDQDLLILKEKCRPGKTPLSLCFSEHGQQFTLTAREKITVTESFLLELEQLGCLLQLQTVV